MFSLAMFIYEVCGCLGGGGYMWMIRYLNMLLLDMVVYEVCSGKGGGGGKVYINVTSLLLWC